MRLGALGLWIVATAGHVFTCPAVAQPLDALCAEVETIRLGEFVYGQTGPYLTATTLRPAQEPVAVGRSVVKGAMARKLSSELDGASVRWSTALLKGPVACGSYQAFQILVDPTQVRVTNQ
jgi:hypothetical protein